MNTFLKKKTSFLKALIIEKKCISYNFQTDEKLTKKVFKKSTKKTQGLVGVISKLCQKFKREIPILYKLGIKKRKSHNSAICFMKLAYL